MGRIASIARRTFLIGSATVAGGVAFGVYKFVEGAPNPLESTGGHVSLNAFVVITEDGVKLVSPKAEMGQGVHTTWAALIAEELDVDWQDITVIHGPPAKAYYNSALFGMALPFTDYKVTSRQQALRKLAGNGAKLLSLQMTGGSTSMRDGFERMRLAGATAREALKRVAANRTGFKLNELETRQGTVIAPDGTVLPYAELAAAAAEIDPPKVTLRDPSSWRYLGKTLPRVDMEDKITGAATFGIDVVLDGMKFASVRMSPRRQLCAGLTPLWPRPCPTSMACWTWARAWPSSPTTPGPPCKRLRRLILTGCQRFIRKPRPVCLRKSRQPFQLRLTRWDATMVQ